MKKIILIIAMILTSMTCFADIDPGVYVDKEQVLADMRTWGIAEGYLKSAIVESRRDIENALKHYQLIDTNSIIYQLKDSEGNLIVPKTEMIALYNAIKNALDTIESDYSVYFTGE